MAERACRVAGRCDARLSSQRRWQARDRGACGAVCGGMWLVALERACVVRRCARESARAADFSVAGCAGGCRAVCGRAPSQGAWVRWHGELGLEEEGRYGPWRIQGWFFFLYEMQGNNEVQYCAAFEEKDKLGGGVVAERTAALAPPFSRYH